MANDLVLFAHRFVRLHIFVGLRPEFRRIVAALLRFDIEVVRIALLRLRVSAPGNFAPAALLDEVVPEAVEQEREEEWIMGEIAKGVALPGLYPANAETMARYEADMRGR